METNLSPDSHPGGDAAPQVSQVAIFTFLKKSFIAGLTWMPLTKPNAARAEAQTIARRENLRLVHIRRGERLLQAAYAAPDTKIEPQLISMAATLANVLGRSWIAIYVIDAQRHGLIAVDEGSIIPGCDFVATPAEVEEKFQYVYALFPNWEHVYGPPHLSANAEPLDLNTVLAKIKDRQLQRLSEVRGNGILWIGLGLIAIIALSILALQWKEKYDAQALARAESQKAPPPPPWADKREVNAHLKHCLDALHRLPLIGAGWAIQNATCTLEAVTVSYKRPTAATLTEFRQWVKTTFGAPITLLGSMDTAEVKLPLPPTNLPVHPAPTTESPLYELYSRLQALNMKVQVDGMNMNATLEPPPTASVSGLNSPPTWRALTFSFNSELEPDAVFATVNPSGFAIRTLGFSTNNGKLRWQVKGEVYENK